jgi:hypothetical protein
MQELLEQEVERQTAEITALHQRVFLLERKLADKQRDESKKVRDAERIVLSRAVEFVDALNTYYTGESGEDQRWRVYLDNLTKAEKALRAAVAALLAAEAAA